MYEVFRLAVGLVGLFCAIMMAALISSHNGFMHAWGGVLLQDIILPFRRRPLGTRERKTGVKRRPLPLRCRHWQRLQAG